MRFLPYVVRVVNYVPRRSELRSTTPTTLTVMTTDNSWGPRHITSNEPRKAPHNRLFLITITDTFKYICVKYYINSAGSAGGVKTC